MNVMTRTWEEVVAADEAPKDIVVVVGPGAGKTGTIVAPRSAVTFNSAKDRELVEALETRESVRNGEPTIPAEDAAKLLAVFWGLKN